MDASVDGGGARVELSPERGNDDRGFKAVVVLEDIHPRRLALPGRETRQAVREHLD